MAYGLKYISTAYGLSTSQWKVEIYEKDYVPPVGSTPTTLSLVGDGIKIGYDREEDRFNTIYSRYAIIDLKVTNTFNLDTLQFDDERKFLIKIYRGANIEFVGWAIPFFSSQPYEDDSISTISIQAKDGINQLKSIDFVDEYPLDFSHKQTVISIISQCLRKLDYNLDLEVYYNKYEDGMLKTASDCPLGQLFINVKSLKTPEKWDNNYDVIKSLLADHDLRIFQANGKWIILSAIEIIDGSVTGRRYDYLGVKQTPNVTLSSDLIIGTGGLQIKTNSIVRKGIPIQSFIANFEFGQSRNLVFNGDFQNIIDYEPEGWTLSDNWENDEVTENPGGGIIFQNTYATRSLGINPDVPINDASLTSNKYLESSQINVETLGTFSLSSEIFTNAEIDAVRVRIQFYDLNISGVPINEMYVTNDGKLTFVPTSIYMYNSGVDSFKMLTLTWNNLNQYGTPIDFKYMKVRIYEGIRLRAGVPSSSEIKYKNIKVAGRPLNVVGEFIGKRVEVTNTALLTSKKYDDVIFTYKDVTGFAKDPEHVHKMYLSDAVGETDATTGKWKRTAETNEYTLIESRLIDRLSQTTRFGDIFEGSVFGYVSLEKTPYITSANKRFLLLYCEYNVQQNSTEIVAVELYTNDFDFTTKVSNVFSDGTVIEVTNDEFTTKIDVGEEFEAITSAGGTLYGGVYTDKGIDSLPINSTDPRATNKGTLLLGPVNAHNIELGNFANNTLVEILGRFGIRNTNNFLGQFSVADLTANRIATLPDRDIEINKWADLSGVPTSFTPSAHFHTIGDVTGLSDALDGKQPLNANLTSLANLSTTGIVRRSGVNTFIIGTNDPITLSGDVTGTGTTAITTTLSNTGVVAGTYRSVTVDAKGRVTAGSVPNYNFEWDSRWNEKLLGYVEFGSDVFVAGGSLGVANNFFLGGLFFDKDSSTGTANQVLMPVTGGVAWTTLSTAQISNFSTNVLGQLLTGFTVGSNTTITSSNSILTAFQNVQAQINAKANSFSGTTNYLPKFTSSSTIGNSIIFDNSLQVGIGTASPSALLHIQGNSASTIDEVVLIMKGNGENGKSMSFQNAFGDLVKITGTKSGGGALADEGLLTFEIATNSTLSEIARITHNGRFGLNTINPLAISHIKGGVTMTAGWNRVSIIEDTYPVFVFNSNSSKYAGIGYDFSSNLNFWVNASSEDVTATGINSLSIKSSNGFIGLFNVDPQFRLDVNGTGRFTGAVQFDAIPSCAVPPSLSNHLTNKAYVDSLSFVKKGDNVKTISLTNITLSGTQTINGVALVASDLILVAGQTTASENGVYVVASGAWTRSTTNDSDAEIRGAYHLITAGTYINQRYINTNGSTITVGTTAINYTLDFGQESDPVWSAFQTANDITPTRIGNWNTAFVWGNHALAGYVKNTGDESIAGTKTFSSPIIFSAQITGASFNYSGTLRPNGTSPVSGQVLTANSTTTNLWKFLAISDITNLQTSLDAKANTDANLVAISALNTVGFIRRTGAGTYSIDANTYLNITGGTLTGALTLQHGVRLGGTGTSDDNTFLGRNAFISRTSGTGNSSIGASSFGALTTGSNNTALGRNAGASVTTGTYNIFIGSNVGSGITTGSNNVLIGGQLTGLSSTLANNIIIADGAGNRRINVGSTGLVGFGVTSPAYRVDVSGDVNVTGMFRLNGSFGADHQFLKSNGTTQEWATLTVGEISDIDTLYASKTYADATYIKRVVDEGERGFFLYADAENTVKEGFFFTNPDTGIMGIHAFRLSGTTVQQYGFQLDKDGLPYWLFADGSRKRILTENDALSGGGGIWTGGTVSTSLNFQFTKNANFLANDGSIIHKQYSSWDGENLFAQQTFGNHIVSSTKGVYLYGGTGDFVYINNVAFDMSNIVSLVGGNAKFSITSLGGGKYKATLVAG